MRLAWVQSRCKCLLGDVSDVFDLFFCFGGREREEESEAKRGGGYFHLAIERGGGFPE